jgi:hypothetical protein
MSCGIFVQFLSVKYVLMSGKFVSFIASCTLCIAVEAEEVIKRRLRNNWEDEEGFEFLRNLLNFVASWMLYVANARKINSLSGNFLTKIIIFCFK